MYCKVFEFRGHRGRVQCCDGCNRALAACFSIAEWPPCDPRRCSGLFDVPLPAHTSMVSTEMTCVDAPSVAFTCKTGAVSTLPHKQPEETSSAHLEESADRTLDRHDHGHVCSDHREAENAGPTLRPMPCRPASPTPNRTPSVTSLRWSSQDSSDLSTAATLSGDDDICGFHAYIDAGNPPTGGISKTRVHGICCSRIRVPPPCLCSLYRFGVGYSYSAAANSVNAGFGYPFPWEDFLRSTCRRFQAE